MIWSDASNEQGIVQDCDWWAGTNSATYPINDKVRNGNDALRQIGALIMRTAYGESFLDDNEADFYLTYTDLVSGEDNVQMAVDVFVLERVRVKDRNGNWQTLDQVSRRELSDEDLAQTGVPTRFYRAGQSIVFDKTPDYGSTNGVELEFQKSVSQLFTASGNDDRVPGFNADYHRLVPLYMARDYTAIYDPERHAVIVREIQERVAAMQLDFQNRNRTEPKALTHKRRTHHIM